jgi:hypothetical protein
LEPKPFDGARFVLYLLGVIIIVILVMLMAYMGTCIYWFEAIISGKWKCDPDNKIGEMFSLLLATIIALLGGRQPGRPPTNGKEPK